MAARSDRSLASRRWRAERFRQEFLGLAIAKFLNRIVRLLYSGEVLRPFPAAGAEPLDTNDPFADERIVAILANITTPQQSDLRELHVAALHRAIHRDEITVDDEVVRQTCGLRNLAATDVAPSVEVRINFIAHY